MPRSEKMKKELLKKLQCIKCGSHSLELKQTKKSAREIVSGTIICKNCGQKFAIRKGIADFLLSTTKEIESERAGWKEFSKGENKEFVQQLPFPKNIPKEQQEHWKRQAANFFQALELLKLNGTEEILDLGAGRCWSTRELAKRAKKVAALDIVEKKFFGLECGDLFFNNKIFFDRVLADMHALPFADETFDVVFSTASLHHSSNLKKAFSEAARVLKKGGKLVLTNEPVRGLFDSKKIDLREKELGINEHKPSFFEWHSAMKSAGFAPQYFFPRAIEQMLESKQVHAEKKYKLLLGKIATKAAGIPTIKKTILKANLPMQLIVGAALVCIARKEN